MTKFDKYVTELEEKRMREKAAGINAELFRRLQEQTREESLKDLYASLIFVGGVSTVAPVLEA
ncbi:MAG: hypothetical protein IJV85_03420 [Clostridia bacterium]|nr:hypothetical protein [Clostridia bacterium]